MALLAPSPFLDISPPDSPKSQAADLWKIPASAWSPRCHPLVAPVTQEVNEYFLSRWSWPNERSKKVFVAADFSRVTCLYFPLSRNDRIALACKLLAVLFLVDDELEEMSLEEGKAYNDSLIATSKGEIPVDPSKPAQVILQDIWQGMREHDYELANSVLEPTFTFMRAQTDKERLNMKGLGNYLKYRERDVGKALLSALMKFSMDIMLSPSQSALVKQLEHNCSRQISIVNDIYSYEKEVKASLEMNTEGAVLCSAVSIFSDEAGMDIEASKRVLWGMVREWEHIHDRLVVEAIKTESVDEGVLRSYVKGLEYQMSGNELWSKTTPRYHKVDM
ncbi:Aristolochene synthase from penicillium Roqueforti [Karstenula rhodostoma CBS 690.94]|uniref:Terpene synthase n=1 Tax=Karstenula rhodostoma CBS 690.94 TaxID=1392251 RepID=A0A9P4PQ78_9PLEO|nr:Aristolochene synthase from penicillium Roqueforti [Karstenula rhodostoma CBS 690.94]